MAEKSPPNADRPDFYDSPSLGGMTGREFEAVSAPHPHLGPRQEVYGPPEYPFRQQFTQRAVSVPPLRGVAGGKNPFTRWSVEPDEGQREKMDSVRVWASHLAEALEVVAGLPLGVVA